MKRIGSVVLAVIISLGVSAQEENTNKNKFRQMYQEFSTPNVYRSANGAPGHKYYQQQADYVMDIVLDDDKQTITGSETITYTNNSPDVLDYLWLQLDQNMRAQDSDSKLVSTGSMNDKMSFGQLERMHNDFDLSLIHI